MDLPEHLWVQTGDQLGQWRADQMLTVAGVQHRVFIVALKVADLVDRHMEGRVTTTGTNPTQGLGLASVGR